MMNTITSTVRHLIGMAVAGLVADGIISGEQVEQLTNGAVMIVTVFSLVAWSYVEKKYFQKNR